ncbi:MAG: hypothetical protein ACP5NZ_04410, partial [Nanobdellota archaeon]
MEKRKYFRKPIKQIKTPKDTENLRVLENIKLFYYPANTPLDKSDKDFPLTINGIFGGTFRINHENYLVLSDISDSKTFSSMYRLTSSLYKLDSEDELIIDQIDTLHGYYSKGSPKTKNQDLESAIRGQVQTFQKNLER